MVWGLDLEERGVKDAMLGGLCGANAFARDGSKPSTEG